MSAQDMVQKQVREKEEEVRKLGQMRLDLWSSDKMRKKKWRHDKRRAGGSTTESAEEERRKLREDRKGRLMN